MGLEPTTSEFRSDALIDWAIRPGAQLELRVIFVQLLQFHLFVVCSPFILTSAFVSHHIFFKWNVAQVIAFELDNKLIHTVFTAEGFLEVAIESWPGWDLIPRPPNPFKRYNRLSYQSMRSTCTQSHFYIATPISSLCSVLTFHFNHCLRHSPHLL